MTLFQRLHRNFRSSRRRQRRTRSAGQEVAMPPPSPAKPNVGRGPIANVVAPPPVVVPQPAEPVLTNPSIQNNPIHPIEPAVEPPLDLVTLCTSPSKSPVRVNPACDALPHIDYADVEYNVPVFHPELHHFHQAHQMSERDPEPRLESHLDAHRTHADHFSDSESSWYRPHEIASSTSISSNLTDLTHVDDGLTDWGLPKVLVPFEDSPVVDVLAADQNGSDDEFFDAVTEVSMLEAPELSVELSAQPAELAVHRAISAAQAKTIESTLAIVYTALLLKRAGVVPKRYISHCRSQIRAQVEAREAQAIADSIIPFWM